MNLLFKLAKSFLGELVLVRKKNRQGKFFNSRDVVCLLSPQSHVNIIYTI